MAPRAVMGWGIEFKAYGLHEGSLLPGSVGDAQDPAVPVLFIDDLVEAMDPTALEAS